MFLLWNDLAEIPNSFDDIGYEVISSTKILQAVFFFVESNRIEIKETAIQNGRLDTSRLISSMLSGSKAWQHLEHQDSSWILRQIGWSLILRSFCFKIRKNKFGMRNEPTN